jgi:hypothetical protein
MEYYSALKNEIMPCSRKWMVLEIIILCKISQTEKDKYQNLYSENKQKDMNIKGKYLGLGTSRKWEGKN